MVLLFFGMLEASDLFTVNRRLANAANSLVDLAAHDPIVTETQLSDMMIGVTRILEPTDTSTIEMRVISIRKGADPASQPLVHWSRDKDGATPYPAGSVYADVDRVAAMRPNTTLLVSEIEYGYVTGYVGRVFTFPFEFEHASKRWPRRSTEVQLCASHSPPAAPVGCTS